MKRIFTLLAFVALTITANAIIQSGSCGDNVTFVLNDDGTLVISGSGEMKNYDDYYNVPWYKNRDKIIKVQMEDGVTSIGNYAFYNCYRFTSIAIPNSVTSIGEMAFWMCSMFTSVTIPNSVTCIGEGAFYDCSSLPIIDNIRYADTYLVGVVDKNCSYVNIKEGIRFIGTSAFMNCSNLTSITIPNSVESIAGSAFMNCSNLTSVTIPNSVTGIRYEAFSGCSSLPVIDNIRYADTYLVEAVDKNCSSANIKEGTRFIGSDAFRGCSSLTSITIPNSVTSIGYYAFSGCSGLTSVTIGNSVTNIGSSAFSGCSGLTSVTIPNSVTSIGSWAFGGCSGLTSITIPNSVTSIGSYAFRECSGLTSVTIGNSVTTIGGSAFYGCSKLKEIHSQAITPPTAYASTFDGISTNYCKLYVPIGTKEDYAFAEGWKLFMNIIEENIISDGDNKCDAPTIEFVDGHLKFRCTTPNATYSYTMTDEDIKTSLEECANGDVPLSATYNITVYAFAEGYDASEPTTATLHWIDGTLDSSDGIKSIGGAKRAILVSSRDGMIKASGLNDGEKVEAYTIDGRYIGSANTVDNAAYISAQSGEVVVLKIGKDSIKTIVK